MVSRVVVSVSIWTRADIVVQVLSSIAARALVEVCSKALVAICKTRDTLTVVGIHVQGIIVALANTVIHRGSRCSTGVAVVVIWAKAGTTCWMTTHAVSVTVDVKSSVTCA